MASKSEPIFISHRRRIWLGLGVFWISFGLIFPTLFLVITLHSPYSLRWVNFEQTLLFVGIPFSIVGLLCLTVFLRSKRIEIYEDHITVFTSLAGKKLEFSYSQITLGKKKSRVEMRRFSTYFRISVVNEGRKFSWEVNNGLIKANGYEDLYQMLQRRTAAVD